MMPIDDDSKGSDFCDVQNERLAEFVFDGQLMPVAFLETQRVKEGVESDTYAFVGDESKDLAIVRVAKDSSTPLQKVLKGTKTFESYVSGSGRLRVARKDGTIVNHEYKLGVLTAPVTVFLGEMMQWTADTDLVFSEVCEPPYEDGRFENVEL